VKSAAAKVTDLYYGGMEFAGEVAVGQPMD
jgi:hypothetical protein